MLPSPFTQSLSFQPCVLLDVCWEEWGLCLGLCCSLSSDCFSPITPRGLPTWQHHPVSRQGPKADSSWSFLWSFSGRIKYSFPCAHRTLLPLLFVALSGCIHRCLEVILSPCGSRTVPQAFHHAGTLSWPSSQQTCSMKGGMKDACRMPPGPAFCDQASLVVCEH